MTAIVSLVSLALLVLGFYLLAYKRPLPVGHGHYPEPAWLSTITAAAQAVHRKERSKQTAKKFSLLWFKEYLSGQRSAFYAWFTWFLILPIVGFLAAMITAAIIDSPPSLILYLLFEITVNIYVLIAAYILWVCAANSTTFFKYFCRIFSVMIFFGSLKSIYYIFM